MKIILLVVGKTDAGSWSDVLAVYSDRLKHYIPFEIEMIQDLKNVKNMSEAQQKVQEGRFILKALHASDYCILLDERGKQYTSMQFASWLEQKMQLSSKRLVFVTGGPYGFSDDVYKRSSGLLSLGLMTFSHQMVRPIFVEQLYRAMTILRGGPYHHE